MLINILTAVLAATPDKAREAVDAVLEKDGNKVAVDTRSEVVNKWEQAFRTKGLLDDTKKEVLMKFWCDVIEALFETWVSDGAESTSIDDKLRIDEDASLRRKDPAAEHRRRQVPAPGL